MAEHAQSESIISRHRFVVLFCTLIGFFLLLPVLQHLRDVFNSAVPPIIEGFGLVVVLAGTVVSVSNSRRHEIIAVALAVPAVLFILLQTYFDTVLISVLHNLFSMVFLIYAIAVTLRFIFTSQDITTNTVCASLCIYMVMGVVWAMAYSVVGRLDPHAFYSLLPNQSGPVPMWMGRGESTQVFYFSFTTLTTLGYGDLVPVSPAGRMLTSVEALAGQLYLAVLVARLVGLHIAESLGQKRIKR